MSKRWGTGRADMAKIIITIEDIGKTVDIEATGDTEIVGKITDAQRIAKIMENIGHRNVNNAGVSAGGG